MMRLFFPACFMLCLGTAAAEPYTAWAQDYEGSEPDTVLLWKFDLPEVKADASGQGMEVGAITAPAVEEPAGRFGQAVRVTGPVDREAAANFIQGKIGTAGALPAGAFTVEFWFQPGSEPTSTDGFVYLVDKMYDRKLQAGVQLIYNLKSGEMTGIVGNGTGTLRADSIALSWKPGSWHHLALTYAPENGRLALFRDGELVGEKVQSDFGPVQAGGHPYRIGNRLGSYYGNAVGAFDNFRVSEKAHDFSPVSAP